MLNCEESDICTNTLDVIELPNHKVKLSPQKEKFVCPQKKELVVQM